MRIKNRWMRIAVFGIVVLAFLAAGLLLAYFGTHNLVLSALAGVFGALLSFIAVIAWRLHRRISKMSTLLIAVRSTIDGQKKPLTDQTGRLSTVTTQLSKVETQLSKVGANVSSFDARIGKIEQQIRIFETIVSNSTLELAYIAESVHQLTTDPTDSDVSSSELDLV